jgi:uncharacterized MnhB-related membrane protein
MIWITLIAVFVIIIAAIAVVMLRNLMAAVVATSVVTLTLSILFVVLRAPDVAMTEAVVGMGLSGVLLAMTLRKLKMNGESDHEDA